MFSLDQTNKDKVYLNERFNLIETYAVRGSNKFILIWMRQKVKKILSDLDRRISEMPEIEP